MLKVAKFEGHEVCFDYGVKERSIESGLGFRDLYLISVSTISHCCLSILKKKCLLFTWAGAFVFFT